MSWGLSAPQNEAPPDPKNQHDGKGYAQVVRTPPRAYAGAM